MDPLAPSYQSLSTREAGAAADEAERKKLQKYSHLDTTHHFVPIAMGVFGQQGKALGDLGRCLKAGSHRRAQLINLHPSTALGGCPS